MQPPPESQGYVAVTAADSSEYPANPVDEAYRERLAGRTLEFLLRHKLALGCNVEKDNIYGVSIALPQIARSAGWPNLITGLVIRSFFFLLVTFFIQGLFLYMMFKEQHIMERFSGQMNLCDFGAFIDKCKGDDSPGCMGPTGTAYTPARLYSWPQFTDRTFVRDSLLSLFPHMHDDIISKVDPGEWGLEDYWCRLASCFVFTVTMVEELQNIFRTMKLLWHVPNEAESWIRYSGDLTPGYQSGIEDVTLQVAGISIAWKVTYFLFIVIPRSLMWKFVCECGIVFLMESAGITEVIVNCVALGFVLGIGDMIVTDFTVRATKDIMDNLKDFHKHLLAGEEEHEKRDTVDHIIHYQHSFKRRLYVNLQLIPIRLMGTCALTGLLVFDYYQTRCVRDETGHWLSKSVHLPKSVDLSIWSAILPRIFPIPEETQPYWQSPEE